MGRGAWLNLHPTPNNDCLSIGRERCAKPGNACAKCGRRAVASPTSVPSIIGILHRTDIGRCIEKGVQRARIKRSHCRFIGTVDEQRCQAWRERAIVTVAS